MGSCTAQGGASVYPNAVRSTFLGVVTLIHRDCWIDESRDRGVVRESARRSVAVERISSGMIVPAGAVVGGGGEGPTIQIRLQRAFQGHFRNNTRSLSLVWLVKSNQGFRPESSMSMNSQSHPAGRCRGRRRLVCGRLVCRCLVCRRRLVWCRAARHGARTQRSINHD